MGDLVLTTFDWVPEPPRGFVRDLRVRWALEGGCLSRGDDPLSRGARPCISLSSRSDRCRGSRTGTHPMCREGG